MQTADVKYEGGTIKFDMTGDNEEWISAAELLDTYYDVYFEKKDDNKRAFKIINDILSHLSKIK